MYGSGELLAFAAGADVLVVITPLTGSTRGLVDAAVLASQPDGALIVNVAGGAVIDSAALTAEVTSGRLKCAMDVFDPDPIPPDHPRWLAENALVTPHVGDNTSAFEMRIVALLGKQLTAPASDQDPQNLVQRGRFA